MPTMISISNPSHEFVRMILLANQTDDRSCGEINEKVHFFSCFLSGPHALTVPQIASSLLKREEMT
jgi:hypothetical protein